VPAGSFIEANSALRALTMRATTLGEIQLPRVFGRGEAVARARELVSAAARDADRAATVLLDTPGFPPESVEAVREAAQLLHTTSITNDGIRAASTKLFSAAEGARTAHAASAAVDPQLAATQLRELVRLDPDSLQPSDWRQLRTLLDAVPADAGPAELPGVASFAEVLDRHARMPAYSRIDRSDARRWFAAWQLHDSPADAHAASMDLLLHRDPNELGREDWRAIRTLLDAGLADVPTTRKVGCLPEITAVAERRAKAYARPGGAPDLAASMDFAHLERYRAAWRLERAPLNERTTILRELVAREPETYSTSDWATLAQLLGDGEVAGRIGGPMHVPGLIRFDEIAAKNVERPFGAAGLENMRRYFSTWRLASAPVEERTARAKELVTRDPHQLTPAEWGDLGVLLDSDSAGAILAGPRELDGLRPVRELVASNASHSFVAGPAGWQVNRYFSTWRRAMDPTYEAKVAAAVEQVASGSASPEARQLVAGEGHRLAELVAGRPPEQQSAIALAMLEMPDVSASRGVEGTLELLRDGLGRVPEGDPAIEDIRARTLELVDRNLARLRGETPPGAVVGYGRHPDYAEVGPIRDNVTRLDQLARAHDAAADTLRW
jgi:hypothetical protein